MRECWLANLESREYAVLILKNGGVAERRLCRAGEPVPSDVLPGVVLPPFGVTR